MLTRVRDAEPRGILADVGRHPMRRAQIFSFARALLQNDLDSTATELFAISARMPIARTGSAPRSFIQELQQRMIADDARRTARRPAPHSPSEVAAEQIYQLRHLHLEPGSFWTSGSRYPVSTRNGNDTTPIHRLVDLGDAAIPALIDALDDRSFTRIDGPRGSGGSGCCRQAMRVGHVVWMILQFVARRDFPLARGDGDFPSRSARPSVEAWWVAREVMLPGIRSHQAAASP